MTIENTRTMLRPVLADLATLTDRITEEQRTHRPRVPNTTSPR
ncbi:hypothetical protein [Enemella sp. A6]